MSVSPTDGGGDVASSSSPSPRSSLVILFGSQTGSAEECAERVAREARRQRFESVTCCSMDEYDKRLLPQQTLVLFVCSTTGQGEPPDNMKSLYRFLLRRDLPSDSLSTLSFGVFGLGDSSYPLFNAIARRLHQRLLELGGQPILERGLGDDQAEHGVDEALDPWLEQLWLKLGVTHPLPKGLTPITDEKPELKYKVEIIRSEESDCTKIESSSSASSSASTSTSASSSAPTFSPFLVGTPACYTPVPLRLAVNTRLTPPTHFQDVRHLEFEIPRVDLDNNTSSTAPSAAPPTPASPSPSSFHPGFTYSPGDVLLIHPRNLLDSTTISWIERTWHVDYARDRVRIVAVGGGHQDLPLTCTIRELFEWHLDVLGTPRRWFFEQLLQTSKTSELEIEKLQDFIDSKYASDFARYCTKEKRTYIEVFQDFPHSTPSLIDVITRGMIPRLRPRQFSIASAPEAHPGRIHILMAVLEITTPFKRKRNGVCSSFLASLESSSSFVPCWIRRPAPGSLPFRPPAPERPLICVGPGTGLAPFRAIIQDCAVQHASKEQRMFEFEPEVDVPDAPSQVVWPPILLFFGNRNRDADYFYQSEWTQYVRDHVLEVESVFSRDGVDETGDSSSDRMRFVQHTMARKRARQIARMLIDEQGTLMVAGSANGMPKDVRNTIIGIFQEVGPNGSGGWTIEQATEYVGIMERTRRYQVEAW